jgi:hypothetical protein
VGGSIDLSSDGRGTTLLLTLPLASDASAPATSGGDDEHDPTSAWGGL